MIGYGRGNVCYIVNCSPGEYLLYSKVSGGGGYYIANIPRGNIKHSGEGLLYDTGFVNHYFPVESQKLYLSRPGFVNVQN